MYQLKSLPKFDKQFKKFYSKEQDLIRTEIKKIKDDPDIGDLKKGVLANIRVHKFKIHAQLYLLAYELEVKTKTIYLYAIDTHENYYSTLSRYMK
ncbi:MAG: type II toxin-antitoxin system RelE/ParE family toxin [Elusimicrobia bacterium]|nr:type II toxin-antitoxin system RelE/ParE family toxin [Elusimicrobiota bacterium]MBU2615172.1 type II toxin-antitoxin system RelE/ParE family toxin [Elusimicrobiota bacterium]